MIMIEQMLNGQNKSFITRCPHCDAVVRFRNYTLTYCDRCSRFLPNYIALMSTSHIARMEYHLKGTIYGIQA